MYYTEKRRKYTKKTEFPAHMVLLNCFIFSFFGSLVIYNTIFNNNQIHNLIPQSYVKWVEIQITCMWRAAFLLYRLVCTPINGYSTWKLKETISFGNERYQCDFVQKKRYVDEENKIEKKTHFTEQKFVD